MPLTEPDLWISRIRLFDSSHVTQIPRIEVVPNPNPGCFKSTSIQNVQSADPTPVSQNVQSADLTPVS